MDKVILIDSTAFENRAVLIKDGQLSEIFIERHRKKSLVGNIYKGKLLKILPGIQSAFLDIGNSRTAFLHISDIKYVGEAPTIETFASGGREHLVQVIKDPVGDKGARLTTNISIPGKFLVLTPNFAYVGVSKKIADSVKREELKIIVNEICPQGYGLIARTAAEFAAQADLEEELVYLIERWNNILKHMDTPAPAILHEEDTLFKRLAREFTGIKIITDDREAYNFFKTVNFDTALYSESTPLFEKYKVNLNEAANKKVELPSGGFIVLDRTEALTVIDVNTGHFVGDKDFEETVLKTNMEAAKEIARQLVLRNIGGIIVVDFIDMVDTENRRKIVQYMQTLFFEDRGSAQVAGITALGLMEITRKRTRESIISMLMEVCPHCEGAGHITSKHTVSYEILRNMAKLAENNKRKNLSLSASKDIIELLKREQAFLEEMKKKFEVSVTFISSVTARKKYLLKVEA